MEKSANSDEVLKISVVMATYNGGRYLSEQLDSIVAQTYPMVEIIVPIRSDANSPCAIAPRASIPYLLAENSIFFR